MVKWIVDTYSSKRDLYGNCYHVSKVTNTRTGKSASFVTPSHSNTTTFLRELFGLEWSEIHEAQIENIPIRMHEARRKRADGEYSFCNVNYKCDSGAVKALKALNRK